MGLWLGFLAGCANPGPLRPPSLNLLPVVRNLQAERVGDAVRLRWTTPAETTDQMPVRGAISAVICRSEAATPAAACTWSTEIPVSPGPSEALDPLSPALRSEPAKLLVYQLRLNNAAGRNAGSSPPTFAAAGLAPPPVQDLHVNSRPSGSALTWQRVADSDASVMLFRTEPHTGAERNQGALSLGPKHPAHHTRGRSGKKPPAGMDATSDRAAAGETEVRLRATAAGPDSGGALDQTAPTGVPLTYRAERVRSVTLDGHTLLLHSLTSPAVAAVLRDTFPPAPPSGLLVVDGTRPADGQQAASPAADLSWEPGSEPDLAGYLVERSEPSPGSEEVWQQLTPEPVASPAFHDAGVHPGVEYRYRIIAVDRTGNRSAPGTPEGVTLPAR